MGSSINGQIHSVSTLVLFSVAPLNLFESRCGLLLTLLLYKRVEKPLFEKVAKIPGYLLPKLEISPDSFYNS